MYRRLVIRRYLMFVWFLKTIFKIQNRFVAKVIVRQSFDPSLANKRFGSKILQESNVFIGLANKRVQVQKLFKATFALGPKAA